MATVFLAEDVKHGRPVAVKLMRPDLTATLGSERFLREIGIAARLAHPHIVPLIDSGETDGLLWFVSPYIAGGSLRERLERGPLPVADVLRIAREAGLGLDYVHRNGFVHRDIKPENILFADEHAVIADFGIARACCGPGAEGVTEIGLTLGTPSYMSPEQAAGETDLQATSDVYSLASVVYEMLAGEPPFHGDSARAVMARQVTETPRPLRSLRPDVPAAVEAAVVRALAKDPRERYPSVADFLAAMTGPDAGAAPPVRSALRCVAVLPFVNASPDPDNEYLSDGITDELITALAKVDGLRVASRTSVFALKGKPQDVRAVGALLGASEVLEGTVRRAGDRLRITAQLTSAEDGQLLWSERYDRHLDDVFAIQDEIARTIVTTLRVTSFADLSAPVPRRYTADLAAYGLYLRGRYAWNRRTQAGVTEAIHCFEQAIAADPAYAPAYTGLADAWALHVDYRSVPVHEGFAKAKAYARQALALDDSLAEAHASLAWSLFIYDWDWEEAAREFRRAVEIQPTYATAHQWYAFLLVSQGRHDEALVAAHTAQELDPASISIRRALGFVYYYARRFEQAAYHCRRAIAMNPGAEESHRILGLTLVEQGKHEEAVRVMREALAMPGSGSYSAAMLGHALARAGRTEEARALLADLMSRAEREYVSPMAFATIHMSLGDAGPALDWLERGLAERRGWLAYLRVHPIADPIRAEPRYRALLERMKLA